MKATEIDLHIGTLITVLTRPVQSEAEDVVATRAAFYLLREALINLSRIADSLETIAWVQHKAATPTEKASGERL